MCVLYGDFLQITPPREVGDPRVQNPRLGTIYIKLKKNTRQTWVQHTPVIQESYGVTGTPQTDNNFTNLRFAYNEKCVSSWVQSEPNPMNQTRCK